MTLQWQITASDSSSMKNITAILPGGVTLFTVLALLATLEGGYRTRGSHGHLRVFARGTESHVYGVITGLWGR